MVEQELILDKNDNVAEVLNNFFINAVSNLNIPKHINHIGDPIARSIEQYKNHPSIVAIKVKAQIHISNLIVFQRQKLRRKY